MPAVTLARDGAALPVSPVTRARETATARMMEVIMLLCVGSIPLYVDTQ